MPDEIMVPIIVSGVFALVGAGFLIVGMALLKHQKKKEARCTSTVEGKVVDLVRHRSNDGASTWNPVFEFTVGETKVRKKSMYGGTKSRYVVGQKMKIFYNPNNYNDFYAKEDALPKTLATIFAVVGAVVLVISAISVLAVLAVWGMKRY